MQEQILILGLRNNWVNKYSQRRFCFLDSHLCKHIANHCVTTKTATVTQLSIRVGKFFNDVTKIKCEP